MTSERTLRSLRVAGAIAVVLVGAWAGARIHSWHQSARGTATPQSAALRVPAGEASPPTASDLAAEFDPASPPEVTIPERLPEFSLGDKDGHAAPISRFAGKSLVLNFWATWCAPCRREIPLLETLQAQWSGRNVEVVGVAVDSRDKVVAYADQLKIGYPLLIGEQDALDVAARFGVVSPVFPFTVFTDRHGEVVTLFVGELHKPQADLILSVVETLNSDRMQLAEARRNIAAGLHALAPDRAT